jgi:hypothetical protein
MPTTEEALTQARIDIAQMQVQVAAQGREIGELKAMVATLGEKLDGVASTLTEAKGGWRLLMALGGAGAAFGAGFMWLVQTLAGKGH